MEDYRISTGGNVLTAEGVIDGKAADAIIDLVGRSQITNIDFSLVKEIKFSALRSFLRARQKGLKYSIFNAPDDIAAKFDDTGVSSLVSVSRAPKKLDLGKYTEFGAGFVSKAFNSEDGDAVIKIYRSEYPRWKVAQEKNLARAVMRFGIPTPLVGSVYSDGEVTGLDFERINGKRSYSRIVSQEPGRMVEMATRFARMCRQLHSTKCDTDIFPDRALFYRNAITRCTQISDSLKARAFAFLDSVPVETTCLHGDMQPSNVITNGVDDLWIDLGDFGYGNHMFDMGMWYFLSNMNTEKNSEDVFHLSTAKMAEFWNIFCRGYFGADTPEKLEEVKTQVEPFTALHLIAIGPIFGIMDEVRDFIEEKLP